jgi:hypothetical protein
MKITLQLISLLIILILGCTAVKDNENQVKEIDGKSTVVGNEPFTKMAIITDNNEVYIYTAPDSIKTLLYKNQGNYFNVKYLEVKDSAQIHIIKIFKANIQSQ